MVVRSLRRVLVVGVLAGTAFLGQGAAPAAAGRYGDTDPASGSTPLPADILDHHVRYAGTRLDTWIRIADRPTGSRDTSVHPFPRGWESASWYGVLVSVDGDDEPDAIADIEWNGSVWVSTTYHLETGDECSSVALPALHHKASLRIVADTACWGTPETIRYAVASEYASFGSPSGTDVAPDESLTPPVRRSTKTGDGYWLLGRDGGVFSFGDAAFYGSTGDMRLNQPVVSMAAHPSGDGYWFVAADGGVFTFGAASFFGSTGNIRLNQPIVGMAPTPTGNGYWLVASDGGIFTFGDAAFYGSAGDIRLVQPIVAMGATPTGRGYWLAARDGGVFTFGDARFYGSAAGGPQTVVGFNASPGGDGYRLVHSHGGVSPFGHTASVMNVNSLDANPPISGMATGPNGGILMVDTAGRVRVFGETHHGDMGGVPLSAPVIGMTATL